MKKTIKTLSSEKLKKVQGGGPDWDKTTGTQLPLIALHYILQHRMEFLGQLRPKKV